MRRIALCGIFLLAIGAFLPGSAYAQATRTWVSGVGDDANPCSRTAPCKTFAGAISKTAPSGEIDCLDPGGFGALTITKSITIDCAAEVGGVLVSGTNGIVVNAAGAAVNLRGLDFNGIGGAGLAGVAVFAAAAVDIENSHIYGFGAGSNPAINVVPTCSPAAQVKIDIHDVTINNNLNGAILLAPGTGCTVTASITRVNMYNNTFGVKAADNAKATIFQSIASNNSNNGYISGATAAPAEINLVDSVAANNGVHGVATSGPGGATLNLTRDAITDNAAGIDSSGGGTVTGTTPGSTLNVGNTNAGSPNGTPNGLQ
jgi:hypothetical protein